MYAIRSYYALHLHDLDEVSLGVPPRKEHVRSLELLAEKVVELVAVPVPLHDVVHAVGLFGVGALRDVV